MELNEFFYQHYWWFLISTLGALLVFLLFVQGGQTLLSTLAKEPIERSMLINSLGRKWEFTFTTLVVFGGAFLPPSLCSIPRVSVARIGCGWLSCSALSYKLSRMNIVQKKETFWGRTCTMYFCLSTV